MSHFDAATAAVEAALAAGARYADARVMHRRSESMSARNGEIENLSGDEDAGIGVRALVGSSWGFFAVPELSDAAARRAGGTATAIAKASAQVRGPYGTRGWELIDELDLNAHAVRIADEARALLTAPLCPQGETTVIIGSEQMALQIHESVGHAIELDRILGWEAAYAGTSWLDLARLGALRFGSDLMTITADATLPGALGSFGYDDEGTPAHPVDIVRDGTWVGVLSGRDTAALVGIPAGGSVRGDGFNRIPMVRMKIGRAS